ncbi:MAG: 7-cyano-7-deazaguanine synthase QueC [Fusobacteriia bacterium 4572_132]|nr:MAG: 7-cyano-7-deazaguanine synthase QueC [Fusobacteriia bacterium 4572_132]
MNKKAVILLSGGLDSTTAVYLAKSRGYEVYTLAFDYGQRHDKELNLAKEISKKVGAKEHKVVKLNMNAWGGSALTDENIEVPDFAGEGEIPVTYVPARNMIFLSIAASYAEALGAQSIFIGVSEVDYSGYVDCRQEFLEAMEVAINKGTVMGAEKGKKIKIEAPFIDMTKTEEIELGIKLGVNYGMTWSCYKGGEKACGVCDSCQLRLNAFKKAGLEDPIEYE